MEFVRDDFADNLPLNYEAMGLAPKVGEAALQDVSLPDNVIDLENYREQRDSPEAA